MSQHVPLHDPGITLKWNAAIKLKILMVCFCPAKMGQESVERRSISKKENASQSGLKSTNSGPMASYRCFFRQRIWRMLHLPAGSQAALPARLEGGK